MACAFRALGTFGALFSRLGLEGAVVEFVGGVLGTIGVPVEIGTDSTSDGVVSRRFR